MTEEVGVKRTKNGWIIAGLVYLLIDYAVLFDKALGGIKHNEGQLATGLFINGLVFWFIWKRMSWNKIYGLISGVALF